MSPLALPVRRPSKPRPALRRAFAVLALATLGSTPAAAVSGSAELALHGSGPYYTVHLPMALHTQAASEDFASLRVLNARGEALPFAWREPPPPVSEEHRGAVPFFKQPGHAAKGPAPAAWVLDTRRLPGRLHTLELRLPDAARGAFTLSVESSIDLQHWQTVLPRVQVLKLEHRGQHLEQGSVPLGGVPPGYLRLKAIEGSPLPELAAAEVAALRTEEGAPALQWSEAIAPSACGPSACDYPLPAHLPLAQLQILANEPNALGSVQVLGQEPPATTEASRPHGLRERLRVLRRKNQPPAPAGWLPLTSTSVYWLRLPEGEFRSAALPFDAGTWPQLRLQTDGPITQLGRQPPSLRVAAQTRSLVFLARGPAPYRLAWDSARTATPPMTLQQLLPLRRPGEALPADSAVPRLHPVPVATPAPSGAAASAPAAHRPPVRESAPWLWAVLAGGLGLMGWMAWTLLRKRPAAH